jgi:hypothetical protein
MERPNKRGGQKEAQEFRELLSFFATLQTGLYPLKEQVRNGKAR